jgi:hypothetical protein
LKCLFLVAVVAVEALLQQHQVAVVEQAEDFNAPSI